MKKTPIEDRFWPKVLVGTPEECWTWIGALNIGGYGRIGSDKSGYKTMPATHVSWKLHTGEDVPAGMNILHKCDNPPCVNPHHLFLGTAKDNSDDKWTKGRATHPPTLYGEANGYAKHSDEVIQEIRRAAEAAPPKGHGRMKFWASLAAQYNTSLDYVRHLASPAYKLRRNN